MDPVRIKSIRSTLLSAMQELDKLMMEHKGCLHEEKEEISTMGNQKMRKFFCHSCGKTIEEEWSEDVENYV